MNFQPPDPPEEDEGDKFERITIERFNEWWMSGIYPLRKCDTLTAEGVTEDAALNIWFAALSSMHT